jgi:hypothetical protein
MADEATTTTTEATPAPAAGDMDLSSLLGEMMATEATPAAPAAGQAEQQPAEAAKPAANVPVDPLAEELFAEEVLVTPEQAREAAKLLREERAKLAELRKKGLNAHSAAEKREKKVRAREQAIQDAEARMAAWERATSGSLQDLESGDAERFLTAVARMSKSADPASYWKKVSMKLASGGTFTEAEKQQAKADPEVQQKLAALESYILRDQAQREEAQIEHLKEQNLGYAKQSAAHPFLKLYATEQPDTVREFLAQHMLAEAKRTGQPIDVKTACDNLEASLKAQYELSQRVGGNTDGEKGTAGSGPDAGRESSGQPPKPETATRAPTTVPASLTATQGQTRRALTEREHRDQLVNSLPSEWWAQLGL